MAYSLEGVRWTAAPIRWSFVGNNGGGTYAQASVEEAFAEWAQASGLLFVEVADTAAPSIRIGYANLNTAVTSEIGHTSYTYSGGALLSATIQLEDPALLPLASEGTYTGWSASFHQVALHEIGHAIGLGHDTAVASIMNEIATTANRTLTRLDIEGIRANYQDLWINKASVPATNPGRVAAVIAQTDTVTGISSNPVASAYNGPVDYLSSMYISLSDHGVAILAPASAPFEFIVTGSGDDGIQLTAGDNIVYAGPGSNFMIGGTGKDTFFMDAGETKPTWNTVANFHAGDQLTLWGFVPGVSTTAWDASPSGAQDYTGATMRISSRVDGICSSSITFADMSVARAQTMAVSSGVQGGMNYLMITNTG